MARAWIYDRTRKKSYNEQVKRAKEDRRTPPGRWELHYIDPAGDEKTIVFSVKKLAETKKTEIEASLSEGSYIDPKAGKMPFRDAAKKCLDTRKGVKQSTKDRYQSSLKNYVFPRWGKVPVNAITFEDVSAWLTELHDADADQPSEDLEGKRPKPKPGKVGASNLRSIHSAMSVVMDWCVMAKRIRENPTADVSMPTAPPSSHLYLSHEQVDSLANAIAEIPYARKASRERAQDYRVLILLLAYTGLRWGEATGLKVGRVDLDKRRIRVVEALAEDPKGRLYTATPKSGEERSVAIPDFLLPELARLLPSSPEDANEYVFKAPGGGPLRKTNFRRTFFPQAVKKAGLPATLTPHKLRHTAASLAIASGADVKVVQNMLGHATATMTLDVYGHLMRDRLDEVADAMSAKRAEALALAA
jgi:integrase